MRLGIALNSTHIHLNPGRKKYMVLSQSPDLLLIPAEQQQAGVGSEASPVAETENQHLARTYDQVSFSTAFP